MEPINTEIPQVQRHCSKREKKRADQERAGRPVNAVLGDSKSHLGNFVESRYQLRKGAWLSRSFTLSTDNYQLDIGRQRITSFLVQV